MKDSPIIEQYKSIKTRYRDALLLFRMGDFYEMFYEDAKTASKVLGITLTSRTYKKEKYPLAGIPVRSLNKYLKKLIDEGLKLAICEQMEKPSKGKKLLKREVVEVISPGTITRPDLISEAGFNYIFSLFPRANKSGIAYLDVTNGEFVAGMVENNDIKALIAKLNPGEVLAPENTSIDIYYTPVSEKLYNETAIEFLKTYLDVKELPFFKKEENAALIASGVLLKFVSEQKKQTLKHILPPKRFLNTKYLYMDRFTIRNLEILKRLSDGREQGSLIWSIKRTLTPQGHRTLKKWLLFPLIEKKSIIQRLDAVEELVKDRNALNDLREILSLTGDIERYSAKIVTNNINPREVFFIAKTLVLEKQYRNFLKQRKSSKLKELHSKIPDIEKIAKQILEMFVENPPITSTEGGIFKPSSIKELKKLITLKEKSRNILKSYEEEEKKKTGIEKLRIKYNNVFGFFIEIPKSYLSKIPSERYFRKQTLTNVERFVTEELKKFEEEILTAQEKANIIEYNEFKKLQDVLTQHIKKIIDFANITSELDVLSSFASIAIERHFIRPKINTNKAIHIEASRHPVIEASLKEEFIPNNIELNENIPAIILTGPNMSGKSTYMRQVALNVLLAQAGSFIPADKASIGIIERIFTRIGASDDVSQGISTFMAEMIETANIILNVNEKSLVILDEIGRGTSTYDGMAIAWAVIESLIEKLAPPFVLFATHYHELSRLEELYKKIRNYHLEIERNKGKIVFLRKLKKGPSDKSYGIDVAKLAGIPLHIIEKAKEIYDTFVKSEEIDIKKVKKKRPVQLNLYNEDEKDKVLLRLKEIDLNHITPVEALNLLVELKKLIS